MDNLAAHKAERVRAALDAAGIAYRYLPAYSPDLNPIEPCWSKLKAVCGRAAPAATRPWRPRSARRSATITAEDARGWFRLAGYPAPD